MGKPEYVKSNLVRLGNSEYMFELKVDFEGESQIPFSYDDLMVKAAIALLNNVDYKNYSEANLHEQAMEDYQNIIDTAKGAFMIEE
ncbi:hypothetical protein ACTWQB_16790 [Piscibacillus sp. B03]|uniref:hypothetical protein n=1 Tax=Piscibacillus sp. B03 TaxID=3457430 RepID=UPI003FCCA43F